MEQTQQSQDALPLAIKKVTRSKRPAKIAAGLEDYPQKIESHATCLPSNAKKLYGCLHCEWKDTALCAFSFKSGQGNKLVKNNHTNGICADRTNYLLSFSRSYKKHPSFDVWLRDFNIGMAQVKLNEDFSKLKLAEDNLREIEQGISPGDDLDVETSDKLERLEVKRKSARKEWFDLWKELTGFHDKQVTRETPKMVEMDVKQSLSLSDIHSLMRGGGEVVDAEVVDEGVEEEGTV